MEDDLDQSDEVNDLVGVGGTVVEMGSQSPFPSSGSGPSPDSCICGLCAPLPQIVENKCFKQKNCVTLSSRFSKLSLDADILQLVIRNMGDIRNDPEDNSIRAFRKAAYRQYVLARYGYLGKGNTRVCSSCVVLRIRKQHPSITDVYMGFKEN